MLTGIVFQLLYFDIGMRYRLQNTDSGNKADQQFYRSLIRLHILHHASKGPVFGLWFIEELARHGYKISAGTLYPLLHGLERSGYLRSEKEQTGKEWRRIYRATPLGRKILKSGKEKVRELFNELLED